MIHGLVTFAENKKAQHFQILCRQWVTWEAFSLSPFLLRSQHLTWNACFTPRTACFGNNYKFEFHSGRKTKSPDNHTHLKNCLIHHSVFPQSKMKSKTNSLLIACKQIHTYWNPSLHLLMKYVLIVLTPLLLRLIRTIVICQSPSSSWIPLHHQNWNAHEHNQDSFSIVVGHNMQINDGWKAVLIICSW